MKIVITGNRKCRIDQVVLCIMMDSPMELYSLSGAQYLQGEYEESRSMKLGAVSKSSKPVTLYEQLKLAMGDMNRTNFSASSDKPEEWIRQNILLRHDLGTNGIYKQGFLGFSSFLLDIKMRLKQIDMPWRIEELHTQSRQLISGQEGVYRNLFRKAFTNDLRCGVLHDSTRPRTKDKAEYFNLQYHCSQSLPSDYVIIGTSSRSTRYANQLCPKGELVYGSEQLYFGGQWIPVLLMLYKNTILEKPLQKIIKQYPGNYRKFSLKGWFDGAQCNEQRIQNFMSAIKENYCDPSLIIPTKFHKLIDETLRCRLPLTNTLQSLIKSNGFKFGMGIADFRQAGCGTFTPAKLREIEQRRVIRRLREKVRRREEFYHRKREISPPHVHMTGVKPLDRLRWELTIGVPHHTGYTPPPCVAMEDPRKRKRQRRPIRLSPEYVKWHLEQPINRQSSPIVRIYAQEPMDQVDRLSPAHIRQLVQRPTELLRPAFSSGDSVGDFLCQRASMSTSTAPTNEFLGQRSSPATSIDSEQEEEGEVARKI